MIVCMLKTKNRTSVHFPSYDSNKGSLLNDNSINGDEYKDDVYIDVKLNM